ncbi:MAG: phosphoribosylanthranilate isomerase [Phycisphaerales bacterium]
MKNDRIKIKVCCIANGAEAELAIGAGADAIGLVSAMPSGPGVIEEAVIREVAQAVRGRVETFLLTSLRDAEAIIAQHGRCGTTTIQLTDSVEGGAYAELRAGLAGYPGIPGVKLVQVIHVVDESSIDEACAVAPHVDALLLDSGNPKLRVKELGGTGRRHDWSVSRRLIEAVDVPVFLAGGLRPGNAREAIETVNPYGLDICSGVRTDGKLDPAKLRAFMEEARGA